MSGADAVKINIDSGALAIIRFLEDAGCEAYAVGGCVRDLLLGRTPFDTDICTSAKPSDITEILTGSGLAVHPTGQQHGTVTAVYRNTAYEVTTFRFDGCYSDGRHPDRVTFGGTIIDDLARRDFTINAMAYHPEKGLIDPFGGWPDLRYGVIRAVGEAVLRFSEDALRMLRAVRFAARMGFTVEDDTSAAIRELSETVRKVSVERIYAELVGILTSPHPEKIALLHDFGLWDAVLPESPFQTALLRPLAASQPEPDVRFAILFLPHGQDAALQALVRLKSPLLIRRRVTQLLDLAGRAIPQEPHQSRIFLSENGLEILSSYLSLMRAVTTGNTVAIERFAKTAEEALRNGDPLCTTDLAVGGDDAFAAGLRGPAIGAALEECLQYVLYDPKRNTREKLTKMLAQISKNEK